jgi:putative protease
VLPRFLGLKEVASLCKDSPEMDFEVFILVGKCPNIEGMCSFLHDNSDGRWPCEWAYSVTCADGSAPPDGIGTAIDGVRSTDRRDGCGLCAARPDQGWCFHIQDRGQRSLSREEGSPCQGAFRSD